MKKCGKKLLKEELLNGNTLKWYLEPRRDNENLKDSFYRIQIKGEINCRWVAYNDVREVIRELGIAFTWKAGYNSELWICKYDEEHKKDWAKED